MTKLISSKRVSSEASQPVDPTVPTQPVAGYVDGLLGDEYVVGWAYDASTPDFSPRIQVRENNITLISGIADKERLDVKKVGIGSGYCGFSLSVPEDLFDGAEHLLEVLAEGSTPPAVLLGVLKIKLPYRGRILPPQGVLQSRGRRPPTGQDMDERQRALQQVGSASLQAALHTALGRVEELDHSNRLLANERDELRSRLNNLSERFGRDLSAIGATPNQSSGKYAENILQTLSITQRRDLWLTQLANLKAEGPIFGTFPHDGQAGKLSILVWGSGGIGDMLYLSTVVRELYLLFRDCTIFVLNENSNVHDIFSTNPYVSGTIWLEKDALFDFIKAAHAFDIFDLVAEVKYAITYSRPPLSRIPQEFFVAANTRSGEWQRYVRYRWPHLNNMFANAVVSQGLTKLDLVGLTSMLPINRYSDVDIFFNYVDLPVTAGLKGQSYVTIHHGSDKKMSALGGVQTKNLPDSTWTNVVAGLKRDGFKTVQLGELHEQKIEGVDIDLRGKTTLRETALVLKGARAHIDTEGGLVHLARSVHTRSVVAFGPTPVKFFGYPQNENLEPTVCGNCWWITDEWAKACPRGLAAPECMSSHSAATLIERAELIAQEKRDFEIQQAIMIDSGSEVAAFERIKAMIPKSANEGAIMISREHKAEMLQGLRGASGLAQYLIPIEAFQSYQDKVGESLFLMPYGSGNVPRNSSVFDWAIAIASDPSLPAFVPICVDLARCVRAQGDLFVVVSTDHLDSLSRFLEKGPQAASEALLGNKTSLKWSPEVARSIKQGMGNQVVVLKVRSVERSVRALQTVTEAAPARMPSG